MIPLHIKNKNKSGLLISFEGAEGSGKTTQIIEIKQLIDDLGYKSITIREPGSTSIGEKIRHILKSSEDEKIIYPEAELLLFAAARAQLVREVIIPSMRQGNIVLCDRYLDSTVVYQGIAQNIPNHIVKIVNSLAVGEFIPSLSIVYDIPVSSGLARVKNRNKGCLDRIEQKDVTFHQALRAGYLMLAKASPERFFVVDGTMDRQKITNIVWNEISTRFDLSKSCSLC